MSNDTHNPFTSQEDIPLAAGPYPVRYLLHSLPGATYKGDARDITPRGFRLHTRGPIPLEECLEIEVIPRDNATGQEPLLVRGQVLCCEPAPEGGYLLSVKTFMKFPKNEEDLSASAPEEHPFLPPTSPSNTAAQSISMETPEERLKLSDLRGPLLVICCLLLMLLLFLPLYHMVLRNPSGSLSLQYGQGQSSLEETVDTPQDTTGSLLGPLAANATEQESLRQGTTTLLEPSANIPVGKAQIPPLDSLPIQAPPHAAETLDGQDRPSNDALISAPLPGYTTPPGDSVSLTMEQVETPEMYPALELQPAPAPKAAQKYIEVQKSEHRLTFFKDQQPLASFPVGLGEADSTPVGHFVIANKLLHPDWFNRGETVKAGDPENPLGDHWMGLGRDGKATSYGIHPTQESASIGDDQSRGCIRMYPSDAKKLFAWCDVGTPVRILP